MDATPYATYRQAVLARLAAYQRRHFAGRDALFEPDRHGAIVFITRAAHHNLFDPALYHALTRHLRVLRSLASSRALTISVLGTLARREDLALLADVVGDDGGPLLHAAEEAEGLALELQRSLRHTHQPSPMGLDVWLCGARLRLAVVGRLIERGLVLVRAMLASEDPHQEAGEGCGGGRSWSMIAATRPLPPADRLYLALRQRLQAPAALRRTTWQALAAAMGRSPW